MDETKKKYTLAILHILTSALCFALMAFFVRLSGDIPTMQKAFFRNAVALVIATIALAKSAEGFKIQKTSWKDITFRCLFGTSGLIANFWAIDQMALADANMLNKMSPFFAMLMSIIILKEKPNKTEWATLIVAFIGAVFIIRPSSGVASFKALIALYGGFGAGTAYAFVRRLGKKGERSAVIVFCFSLFSTMVTLPFLVAGFKPMSGGQIIILSLAGISAAIAQFNITAAYQLAPAKSISVFDYTQVIFAAILAAVFLKDYPDSMSYIGYALIIGAAVIKWLHGLKKNA